MPMAGTKKYTSADSITAVLTAATTRTVMPAVFVRWRVE